MVGEKGNVEESLAMLDLALSENIEELRAHEKKIEMHDQQIDKIVDMLTNIRVELQEIQKDCLKCREKKRYCSTDRIKKLSSEVAELRKKMREK